MMMIDVKGSSNISKIGYDGVGVVVEFKIGSRYRYEGAPSSLVDKCLSADSAGKFVAGNLIGKFKTVQLQRRSSK